MLDLHCHYLPGVDDGARTLEEGLALVRAAAANGIERIVLTPHVHPTRYDNARANLQPRFVEFCGAVEAARIPVELALGGEARLCDELLPMIERGDVPLLISSIGARTLLLEMPHSHVPAGSAAFVRWLMRRGIAPLLVHPERNKELMTHPERLQRLREAGCMVQITAASIVGSFGARAQRTAYFFLDHEWVDIVASDAHNLRHRPPLMREARAVVARRYGEPLAQQLFFATPHLLTAGSFSPNENSAAALDRARYDAAALAVRNTQEIVAEISGVAVGGIKVPIENAIPEPEPFAAQISESGFDPARGSAQSAASDLPAQLEAGRGVCDAAIDRMRSKLLQRASEPSSRGAKAARILELMNSLQAR